MRKIRRLIQKYSQKFSKFSIFFLALCPLLILSITSPSISADSNEVHLITLDDATVNPVTADYISGAIDQAALENVECLIIKLDTPGGLLNSTRSIVKKMMASTVPVVVYIAPGGSRAGSAGVFITYASHIAAMAPSTNIGAAHPVQLGGKKGRWDQFKDVLKKNTESEKKTGSEEKETSAEDNTAIQDDPDPMSSKILQDTVAFIRAIAKERNRNEEWAITSVTKSLSITENDAIANGVVEIIAKDEADLLKQLDGRKVMVNNVQVTLNTKNAVITNRPMDFRQRFFNVLANPNIAYIFMILGFYGLLYEVTHPGIGVPGVMGLIFLILAFYSMQTLPTNYAGLALIILSLVLFIAEAYVPGLGLLTLGGVICMLLGSMLIFDSPLPMMRVSLSLVLAFTLTTAAITLFLVKSVLRVHQQKTLSGREGMIGLKGKAEAAIIKQKEGKVFVHGELWNAVSDTDIKKGDKIVVIAVDGMTLKVKRV